MSPAESVVRIETSAPGKLVILGEYAVLEGAPALVSALNARSRVLVEVRDEPGVWLEAPDIGAGGVSLVWDERGVRYVDPIEPEVRSRLNLVETVLGYFGSEVFSPETFPKGLRIVIDTHEFFSAKVGGKLGIGSSAATCVALAGALSGLQGESERSAQEELDDLFQLSLRLHREVQGGVGSGVDIAASVYGGWLEFRPRGAEGDWPEVVSHSVPPDLEMMSVFTGISTSTAAYVKEVFGAREHSPLEFDSLMGELREVSEAGVRAFAAADVPTFLSLITGYFALLGRLGDLSGVAIVTPPHRDAQGVIVRRGGVYKSSGAGGGDIGVGFLRGDGSIEQLQKDLENKGLGVLPLTAGAPGFRIKLNLSS